MLWQKLKHFEGDIGNFTYVRTIFKLEDGLCRQLLLQPPHQIVKKSYSQMDWHKILHVSIFLNPFSSSMMGKINWQKINFQMDWHNILYMVIFLQPFSSSKMGTFWYLPYKIEWQYHFLLMGSFWNFTNRTTVYPFWYLPFWYIFYEYI